jgi:chromosome segregation ATPase
LTPASGWAQQDSREREAVKRLRQQVARLERDNELLQRQKDELEAKLKVADTQAASARQRLEQARRDLALLAAARKESTELRTKLQASDEQLKRAAAAAAQAQSKAEALQHEVRDARLAAERASAEARGEGVKLQRSLELQTARADTCEAKNAQLYLVTKDLIDKYKENRGAWEKFLLSEPFTGLKSVQVENLLDDMGERAADAKVSTPASPR